MQAARIGDELTIEALLAGGADPNLACHKRATALRCAVSGGHRSCVAALLAGGADANAARADGWTAAHWAAKKGDMECLTLLLAGGASPNAACSDGQTLLHICAAEGHTNCLSALLAAGASPNAVETAGGDTPLHATARAGHVQCIPMLLNAGAKLGLRNACGRTPAAIALEAGHINTVHMLHEMAARAATEAAQKRPSAGGLRVQAEALLSAAQTLMGSAGGACACIHACVPAGPLACQPARPSAFQPLFVPATHGHDLHPCYPLPLAESALECLPSALTLSGDLAAAMASQASSSATSSNHRECAICMVLAELVALVPCGHRTACGECAALLLGAEEGKRRCPICRAQVSSSIRVFDA